MMQKRLAAAIWESDKHIQALQCAQQAWNALSMPSCMQEIENNIDMVRICDQLLFRFTKLQDSMGMRLIPATLAVLQEPYEAWPMLDRLHRLEKMGFLDTNEWLEWRDIRNSLAHEYPDEDNVRFINLQRAIQGSYHMLECYLNWKEKLYKRTFIS